MVYPTGKIRSIESRKKQSESMKRRYKKGIQKGGFKKGYVPPNKGKRGSYIKNGYRSCYRPEHPNCDSLGFIAEHRLIMEKNLGKLLKRGEVVHHINRNRLDNNIENLQILNHNEHRKITLMEEFDLIEKQKVREAINNKINEYKHHQLTRFRFKDNSDNELIDDVKTNGKIEALENLKGELGL